MVTGAIEIDGAHRRMWSCRSHGNAPRAKESPQSHCALAAGHDRNPLRGPCPTCQLPGHSPLEAPTFLAVIARDL